MNEKERKMNYWRGFAVATALWLILSAIYLTVLIDKLN